MKKLGLLCAATLATFAFGLTASAATPDPSQSLCPYGGSAAAQTPSNSSTAACPVAGAPGATVQRTGTLALHVVQGTPGGPAVAGETVNLAIYSNGQLIDQTKAKLAKDATLSVNGLPVSAAVQPVVSIDHAGATYTVVGDPMDAQHQNQKLELKVYESTVAAPQWSVAMRHIITQPTKTGVDVTDMIAIHNPDNRAWIGIADKAGLKQTISLALPPGATDVKTGGDLPDNAATFADGKLAVHQAILPGDSKYEIQYTIPATKGAAKLLVTAPTDVQHVLVFVPKGPVNVTTDGLQALDPDELGPMGAKMRAFMAIGLTAGQTITINFDNLSSVASTSPGDGSDEAAGAAPLPTASASASSAFPAKQLAIGGAMVILVSGGSAILLKAPKNTK